MENLVGVVSKPQFDTNVFVSGKAIHVRQFALSNGHKLKDVDGLIGRVNPLEIIVWKYDEKEVDCDYIEIPIEKVISTEYEITLMQEDK